MNFLSTENITKSFNERILFNGLTFGLNQGDKIALVGANGTGKTTFLKIIAGLIPPDGGVVSIRKGLRVCYLPQEPELTEGLTVLETVFRGGGKKAELILEYELAMAHPEKYVDRIAGLMEEIEDEKAWDYEAKAGQTLARLSITDLEQKVESLSGGQKKRLAMAQLLLSEPDLILMDEPTNHLDLDAIEYLESLLNTDNTTVLMVTHDRYFLDNVCNGIAELDNSQLYKYKGNYAYFLEKKADRESITKVMVEKARNLMAKELEWMRRQPKARGTKAKYRVEAFDDIKEAASVKLGKDKLELSVKVSRQGGKVIELANVDYHVADKNLLTDFTYIFQKQDRVGLLGRNGIGKSTLLNLITGNIKPTKGKVSKGETTKIGYYTQEVSSLNPNNRIIDEVKEIADFILMANGEEVTASKLLDMFLFPPKQQYDIIGKLSGGEKRRLQLLKVLIANPNFLILDEPTNDLDIDTLNVLEDFLENYSGCLVLVSHDRYFMDKLINHLFVFEGDGHVSDFPGNYTEYRNRTGKTIPDKKAFSLGQGNDDMADYDASLKAETTAQSASKESAAVAPKRKLTYKEQQELQSLDASIPTLEADIADLENEISNVEGHTEIMLTAQKIESLKAKLDTDTLRWLALQEV